MTLAGFDVRFHHHIERGLTTCVILSDGREVGAGASFCSKLDQFSRKVGRKVSLGRALRRLPKTDRTRVWNEYLGTFGV